MPINALEGNPDAPPAATPTAVEQLDSYQTVETLGGTTSRDVQQAIYRAVESGVTFPVRVPLTPANRADHALVVQALEAIAHTRAGNVAAALAIPGVVGMYAVQEFNAQNEQEDHWIVTVASSSGSSSTTIDVPFRNFVQALTIKVPAVVAALDQGEAVGA